MCAGFYLLVAKRAEKPAPVIEIQEARKSGAGVTPPGVIRAGQAVPASLPHRSEMRREISATRSSSISTNEVARQTGPDVIRNEFVLSFRNENDRSAFMAKARAAGAEILDTMKHGSAVLVRVTSPEQLREILKDSPEPAEYAPNYYVLSPEIPRQQPMKPDGTYAAFGSDSLKWLGVKDNHALWGNGIMVAVLDTGVGQHAALREDRILRIDLVNEGGSAQGASSHAAHASAVASIIAGNAADIQGIAPAANIMSVKVLNSDGVGDSFTVAKGITEAVDRGAKVINLCLGTFGDSFVLKSAVDYAIKQGAVVVAAVGNEAVEGVSYPARYEGVVAVSAVDAEGRHMYFANRGEEVTLAAPGVGVNAAWSDGKTMLFSGTSAAVPFVSGAVAALLSEDGSMTAADAISTLVRYTDDAGVAGRDENYGYGILDMKRVTERNTRGIYDVGVGDVCIRTPVDGGKDMKVVVNAQNRGTEELSSITIKAEVDGVSRTSDFHDLAVGQTVSMEIPVDAAKAEKAKTLNISYYAVVDKATDSNPVNNGRRVVVVLGEKSK
jgi:subtilisin family serine protease